MPENPSGAADALTNTNLSPLSRTIYAWILVCEKPSVTISEVSAAMKLHRVTAGSNLSRLQEVGLLERFLATGNNKTHHWRLISEA